MTSIIGSEGAAFPDRWPMGDHQSAHVSSEPTASSDEVDLAEVLLLVHERLTKIENVLCEESQPTFRKEWFSVAETAEILDKAPFTVREWARKNRINAFKRPSGRGKTSEWMISHSEIERYKNNGLLPEDF